MPTASIRLLPLTQQKHANMLDNRNYHICLGIPIPLCVQALPRTPPAKGERAEDIWIALIYVPNSEGLALSHFESEYVYLLLQHLFKIFVKETEHASF